eukprot:2887585-Ditylum_brightwellii.AAC.1
MGAAIELSQMNCHAAGLVLQVHNNGQVYNLSIRNSTVATATKSNSNSNLVPPALEESDTSDDEADSRPNSVLGGPLYWLDNLTEVDKKLIG